MFHTRTHTHTHPSLWAACATPEPCASLRLRCTGRCAALPVSGCTSAHIPEPSREHDKNSPKNGGGEWRDALEEWRVWMKRHGSRSFTHPAEERSGSGAAELCARWEAVLPQTPRLPLPLFHAHAAFAPPYSSSLSSRLLCLCALLRSSSTAENRLNGALL